MIATVVPRFIVLFFKSLGIDWGLEAEEKTGKRGWKDEPFASGLGRSTSVALGHGAGSGGKGSGAERADGSRLGQGCAKHAGRERNCREAMYVCVFLKLVWWQLRRDSLKWEWWS